MAVAIVIALLIGAGVGWLVARNTGRATPAAISSTRRGKQTATASARRAHRGVPSSTSVTRRSAPSTTAPPPLQLSATSPADGARHVAATGPFIVRFSAPLAGGSPMPRLIPTVPGRWTRSGDAVIFRPSMPLLPLTALRLVVPNNMQATDGARLLHPEAVHFRIADGSVLRLQQLLSLLEYSPLAFSSPGEPPPTDVARQRVALYRPPSGTFAWRQAGWPVRLTSLWVQGSDNVFTRGLTMSFQADHGLDPNGARTAALWGDLLAALAQGLRNHGGYNYALANKVRPEHLLVYHDGSVVVASPANTGIAGSPTPNGTFPVYTRLRRQVMRGKNPNGTKYADLVQYIAYFHGNDAVHYMPRAGYGIPQSLGCIELPLAKAATAWPYLAYGTLVTVTG